MITLITGASHTGKSRLARDLAQKTGACVLSLDLLKMGLIRSKMTTLSPEDDHELEIFMWPLVREMIRTAIENGQDLVVEGGYIPFAWSKDFDEDARKHIRFLCLVMSSDYIRTHIDDITAHAEVVQTRGADIEGDLEFLLKDNQSFENKCKNFGFVPVLIENDYLSDLKRGIKF